MTDNASLSMRPALYLRTRTTQQDPGISGQFEALRAFAEKASAAAPGNCLPDGNESDNKSEVQG